MRQKARKRDEIVAYHEAGHVAAHYHLGMPIRKVTIMPTKDFDGCCFGSLRKLPNIES